MTTPTLKLTGVMRHGHTNAPMNLVLNDPDLGLNLATLQLGLGMKASNSAPSIVSDFEINGGGAFVRATLTGQWTNYLGTTKMADPAYSPGGTMTQDHYIFAFLAPDLSGATSITLASNPVKIR